MSQPFDTHSYPVVPTTETSTGFAASNDEYSTQQSQHSNPQHSSTSHQTQQSVDNATSNAKQTAQNVASTVVDTANSAYNAAANHPLTRNAINGPVAQNLKDETNKTTHEFSNLANSRQRPHQRAATGQHLTHYHSFFSTLFSWENPRASAVAYIAIVLFIFGARYLDLLRYAFKVTWMALGLTAAAEVAGQTLFNTGFISQLRPRRYYTLPKETLDSMTGDLDELINFFVIESQRLLFAENVAATIVAFMGAFISYYLVKVVPFWGLALIGSSVLFLTPLVYKQNKEVIDAQVRHFSRIVNQQTVQARQIATQQAQAAAATTKHFVDDYTTKAQELVGNASRKASRSVSPTISKNQGNPINTSSSTNPYSATTVPTNSGPMHKGVAETGALSTGVEPVGQASVLSDSKPSGEYALGQEDFPHVPKTDITTGEEGAQVSSVGATSGLRSENEPLLN